MEKLTVERNIWIKAPRERVWKAITEEIQQWWGGEDRWEISTLEVGGTIKFGYGDEMMLAKIDVMDAPRQFTIQWPPQEQYHSILIYTTYLLAEENGGTRVTVSETGFELLPDDVRQKRYDSTLAGYETVLAGLKTHVEGGA